MPHPRDSDNQRAVGVDLLWLLFLAALAVLPPIIEIHKQLTLLGIGLFQLFDERLMRRVPAQRASIYRVLVRLLLATLLVAHTGNINSSYYLIYFMPVVTAATLFDIWGTLLWTLLAAAAYCSFLIPALHEYELTTGGAAELAIRILFFFLAAVAVNRYVEEDRRRTTQYRLLAETLAETNRRLEQAQAEARRSERLAALGQLAAGLAHEIRNPLAVIKGSAETLSRHVASGDHLTLELAEYISGEVNRLNGLVSRFLDFARPLKVELRPQELIPVLERALKAARDRWPDAPVAIEQNYAPNLPCVALDDELAEQVFVNLIFNAYQAMLPAGGKLRLVVAEAEDSVPSSAGALAPARRGVAVDVEDSGPGIPEAVREQIFNPFFTTRPEGMGLGLSVVSKIVDGHGGWVRVMSGAGEGGRFRVFFPAAA
jgi:signal transduction histidine kinase